MRPRILTCCTRCISSSMLIASLPTAVCTAGIARQPAQHAQQVCPQPHTASPAAPSSLQRHLSCKAPYGAFLLAPHCQHSQPPTHPQPSRACRRLPAAEEAGVPARACTKSQSITNTKCLHLPASAAGGPSRPQTEHWSAAPPAPHPPWSPACTGVQGIRGPLST